jgi:hypothetical protein
MSLVLLLSSNLQFKVDSGSSFSNYSSLSDVNGSSTLKQLKVE